MEFALRMEKGYDLNMKVLLVEPYHGRSRFISLEYLLSRCPRGFFQVIKYISTDNQRSNRPALYLSREPKLCYQLQLSFGTTIVLLSDLLIPSPGLSIVQNSNRFVQETREIRLNNANDLGNMITAIELLTSLTADKVIFESYSILIKFMRKLEHFIINDNDFWLVSFIEKIIMKSKVVYCPLDGRMMTQVPNISWKNESNELVVIWPHCWEFDRNPMSFLKIIQRLDTNGFKLKIRVLEELMCKKPSAFHALTEKYKTSKLFDFGYYVIRSTDQKIYYTMLKQADVVLTTCMNEVVLGVTIAEAVCSGCVPVTPNNWFHNAFPEEGGEIYKEEAEIYNILAGLCRRKMMGAIHCNYRPLAAVHGAEAWFRDAMRNISSFPTE